MIGTLTKNNMGKKYTINEDFFNHDTEKTFWLAGFIAARSSIMTTRRYRALRISAKKEYENDIIKIKNLLEFSGEIKHSIVKNSKKNQKHKDSYYVTLTICKPNFIDTLSKFNLENKKEATIQFPKWIKNHFLRKHFLRGWFDGKGNSNIRGKHYEFQFSGSIDFLNDFCEVLKKDAGFESKVKVKIVKELGNIRFRGNRIASKIAHYFYNDANIYLERKKEKVQNLL